MVALVVAVGDAAPAHAVPRATTPCDGALQRGVLPAWARTGFSQPRPRIAHALGRSGNVLAILFASPLHAPPARDRTNKILWVARKPADFGDMRIVAQRMRGAASIGKPVVRGVPGGPGPSIIDLPAAGCWRFTLTWKTEGGAGSFRDALDLRYVKPASS